jgi:hypothetical protein
MATATTTAPPIAAQWLGLLDLPSLARELRRAVSTSSAVRAPALRERADRAARAVGLRITEADRCPPGAERRRMFLLARESVLDCAESLDRMRVERAIDPSARPRIRALVRRLCQLLARLGATPREVAPGACPSREPTGRQRLSPREPSGVHRVVREPNGIQRAARDPTGAHAVVREPPGGRRV